MMAVQAADVFFRAPPSLVTPETSAIQELGRRTTDRRLSLFRVARHSDSYWDRLSTGRWCQRQFRGSTWVAAGRRHKLTALDPSLPLQQDLGFQAGHGRVWSEALLERCSFRWSSSSARCTLASSL